MKARNECDMSVYKDSEVRISLVLRDIGNGIAERTLDGKTMYFPVYRWGQDTSEYNNTQPFLDDEPLVPLVEDLKQYGNFNHCIGIGYFENDKKSIQHSPPHRDKQAGLVPKARLAQDMRKGTNFVVINLQTPEATPRIFQLYKANKLGKMPESKGKWEDAKKVLAWEAKLPHGAAIIVTAKGNNNYLHCVPLHGEKYKVTKDCTNITITHEHAANVPVGGSGPLPDGCLYFPNYLTKRRADELLKWSKKQHMAEITLTRALALKRSPKFVHVSQIIEENGTFRHEWNRKTLKKWFEKGKLIKWNNRRGLKPKDRGEIVLPQV